VGAEWRNNNEQELYRDSKKTLELLTGRKKRPTAGRLKLIAGYAD
jgi:hypothetical protein